MLLFSLFRNNSTAETVLFGVFAVVIVVFLLVDLGVLNKTAHKITTRSALIQSVFWVLVSTLFGYLVYLFDDSVDGGTDALLEYFSAYLTEYPSPIQNRE